MKSMANEQNGQEEAQVDLSGPKYQELVKTVTEAVAQSVAEVATATAREGAALALDHFADHVEQIDPGIENPIAQMTAQSTLKAVARLARQVATLHRQPAAV